MKIIVNDGQFKTTVLFIHGYNKTGLDWNVTEHGKRIRKSRNTIIVSLDDQDYQRPPAKSGSVINAAVPLGPSLTVIASILIML